MRGPQVRFWNRTAQQRRHFFLDVDDDVGLAQFFRQTGILALQLQIFLFQWIALGLGPSLLRSQRFQDAVGPLTSPGCQ